MAGGSEVAIRHTRELEGFLPFEERAERHHAGSLCISCAWGFRGWLPQYVTCGSLIASIRTGKAFGVAALNTGEPSKRSLLQQHPESTQVGMHALEPASSGDEHALRSPLATSQLQFIQVVFHGLYKNLQSVARSVAWSLCIHLLCTQIQLAILAVI